MSTQRQHTIIVRPTLHFSFFETKQLAAHFQIHLDRLGHLASEIELEPLPAEAEMMLTNLSLAFGFGVAVNLMRSEADIGALRLEFLGTAHTEWQTMACIFNRLSSVPLVLEGNFTNDVQAVPSGASFLVSGGKDSLMILSEAQKVRMIAGCPGIYLGRGSELNWRQELPQVEKLARHFDLKLHHVQLVQSMISSKVVLRFGNRAAWRELVTLILARMFGDHIYTGINNDALARLEWTDPHFLDFFSQLMPTLESMQQILDARIETAPGEFDVYRRIRSHLLFNINGSCLRPDCQTGHLCAKCRGFAIYEKILSGVPLNVSDIKFIHSDLYLGDSALLAAYPKPMEVMI